MEEGEEDDLSAARLLLRGPAQQLQATAGTVCTTAQLVYKRSGGRGEEDDLSAARLLLRGPAQQLQATAGTVCTIAQLEKCEREQLCLPGVPNKLIREKLQESCFFLPPSTYTVLCYRELVLFT